MNSQFHSVQYAFLIKVSQKLDYLRSGICVCVCRCTRIESELTALLECINEYCSIVRDGDKNIRLRTKRTKEFYLEMVCFIEDFININTRLFI